jgi:imidazolonepropionase
MHNLLVLPQADVLVEGGVIREIAQSGTLSAPRAHVVEAQGRVLMPAFVDCHTHALWAGSRVDEWERKLAGASYLDILRSGGGIMSTVRAVRACDERTLTQCLHARSREWFARGGTLTMEVKSGYGLSTQAELMMLRAIAAVPAELGTPSIVGTALLGHALDPSTPDFVRATLEDTLPAVHREFAGITIDAYCESGAWSLEDTCELFARASALGHPLRVHADQFHSLGMVSRAIAMGARSVDHLEASSDADLDALARSQTVAVGLPICGMHMDGRYARLRRVVDGGGAVAIATNCNPGSAPSASMPLAIALAVRHCGLSVAEAITASTVNGAAVLGLADRGTIEVGQRADMIVLEHSDERELAYALGGVHVRHVIQQGRLLS